MAAPAPLSPAQVELLVDVARQLDACGHGEKGAILQRASRQLGRSQGTVYRMLQQVALRPQRRRRRDAGEHLLSKTEAQQISAFMTPHVRGNGKVSITLENALRDLRENGLIRAARLDPDTGEWVPLSESAVAKALRAYGLHPEQLRRPAPAQRQKSLHPNHVWQMDASVCTLFYMDDDGSADMPREVFYKNKPENFERVARKRVTRFVITDHTSGAIRVRYYLGGESEANFTEFFIWAMQKQPGHGCPMHGVPFVLEVDAGSGMATAFKNLVRRLRIELIVNAPGNPRGKGSVEGAQNIVEQQFEYQFRSDRPASLDELNRRAEVWADNYNAQKEHGRHGLTRYQKWLEITPEQLRVAPPVAMCRQLLTAAGKACKIDTFLQVQFGGGGRRWSVKDVPGVMVGEKLDITWNPYNDREVFAVFHGADGQEELHPCPLVEVDAHGFEAGAVVIGTGYRALPDTVADTARKLGARIATGAQTDEEAKRALRRKGTELMAGRVRYDYLERENAARAPHLPRAGQALTPTVATPAPPARVLTIFEAAKTLAARLGQPLAPAQLALLRQSHPEGVPEDQLDALQQRLATRGALRVVGGES